MSLSVLHRVGALSLRQQTGRRCRLLSTTSTTSSVVGRPPMPRVQPTSSRNATPTSSDPPEKPKRGSVLIATGWIILGLLTVDRVLQYMDHSQAQSAVAELREAEDKARQEFYEAHKDLPVLHETVVKFEYKMSGTRGLKGVSLNDRLEVLEEGVGPNGTYATCRKRDENTGAIASIGWYPLSFMEKVEQAQRPKRKFLGLF